MLRASGSTCAGILAPEGFSVIVPPWFLPTLSLDFKLELLAKDPHSRSLIYSELGRDVGWGWRLSEYNTGARFGSRVSRCEQHSRIRGVR